MTVCSPHHVQVKLDGNGHNLWIDSTNVVKYKLAGQAGKAKIASSFAQLINVMSQHGERNTDLVNMRQALELTELIASARRCLPQSGAARAVFVDAGFKEGQARIGVVEVAIQSDGEHVKAESHPCVATNIDLAETEAIQFAIGWTDPDVLIFCDNQQAVNRGRQQHGDRVRWLPRESNRVADQVANVRQTSKKKRRGRKAKKPK